MAPLLVLGAIFLAGTGYVAWRFYFQPKWDGRRWVKAAAALGLTLERGGSAMLYSGPNFTHPMVGAFGGVPVRARIRVETEHGGVLGPNRRIVHYTCVEAALARPLDIGLRLSPSGWVRWLDALGEVRGDIEIGHRALDAAYTISAADLGRAQRLLTTPYVLEPLLALSTAGFRPYLTDAVVKLEARRKCLDADVLYGAIENAVELASRLAAARDALGPSHLERVVGEVWRTVAAARGLSLDVERRVMSGRTEGVYVEVHALQRDTYTATRFGVRFDRPLGLGLRLQRQDGLTGLGTLLGMQDIQTGDATFDARFVVKGQPENAVRAALTPEVRARLVSLQERAASLAVEDDHLYADVAWLVSEPEHLHGAIAAIAQAGAALHSGVVSERATAGYRG